MVIGQYGYTRKVLVNGFIHRHRKQIESGGLQLTVIAHETFKFRPHVTPPKSTYTVRQHEVHIYYVKSSHAHENASSASPNQVSFVQKSQDSTIINQSKWRGHSNIHHGQECNSSPVLQQCQQFHCFIPRSAEHRQHIPAQTSLTCRVWVFFFFFWNHFRLIVSAQQCICGCDMPHPLCTLTFDLWHGEQK